MRGLQASTIDDDGVDTSNSDAQVVVLLFMFVGLAAGVVIQQILTRTSNKVIAAVPYTVVLFLIGLGMAGYSKSFSSDEFNQSLNDWVRIDADLMLFIFLPPLVFGEAMSLNWHHWKMLFSSSLLLAGPGVIIGTLIFGMFVKILLPYGWSWTLCLCFSSVLAATDTVAVLSIMQNAGASPKLTILIVGESLLNDGTGMVCFELFLQLLKSPNAEIWSIATLTLILKLLVGSVFFGLIIGLITVRWLRSINRPLKDIDSESQIAITMIIAYLTFYVSQHVLEISGLLSLVSAALMLAWLAPPIILNKETMHHIWGFIEWTFNTIIFLLAGLIIGHRVLDEVQGT
jgi:NhaP-type Na+/H+ or K+/H+ antiporter